MLGFPESSHDSIIHAYGHVADTDAWPGRTASGGRWRMLKEVETGLIPSSVGLFLSEIRPMPFWSRQESSPEIAIYSYGHGASADAMPRTERAELRTKGALFEIGLRRFPSASSFSLMSPASAIFRLFWRHVCPDDDVGSGFRDAQRGMGQIANNKRPVFFLQIQPSCVQGRLMSLPLRRRHVRMLT